MRKRYASGGPRVGDHRPAEPLRDSTGRFTIDCAKTDGEWEVFEYYEFRNAEGRFTIERSASAHRGKRGATAWSAVFGEDVLAQGQDPAEVLGKLLSGDCRRTSSGINPADCRLPREISHWRFIPR